MGATPPTIGTYNTALTNQATVYVPLQYLDTYRNSEDGPITDTKLYPMLSPSTAYSTFSFDKAVDLSSIAGLNDSGNTLTAYPLWEEPGIAVLWWTANKMLTAWLYLLLRKSTTKT